MHSEDGRATASLLATQHARIAAATDTIQTKIADLSTTTSEFRREVSEFRASNSRDVRDAAKLVNAEISNLHAHTASLLTNQSNALIPICSGISTNNELIKTVREEVRDNFQLVLSKLEGGFTAPAADAGMLSKYERTYRRSRSWTVRSRKTLFGTLIFTSLRADTYDGTEDHVRSEISVSFRYLLPAAWLLSKEVVFQFSVVGWGLKPEIQLRTVLPAEHPAFVLAAQGNVAAVLEMLRRKEISVWDYEEKNGLLSHGGFIRGGTLLHVRRQLSARRS
jgi:hypothetical protein